MNNKQKFFPHFLKPKRSILLCGLCLATMNATASLVIVSAAYGNLSNPSATADVTVDLAAMVKNDELNVQVNNDSFEKDPAEGVGKQLRVDYELDGVAGSKTLPEGARLKISASDNPVATAAPKSSSSKLIIRKAQYGDLPDGSANDVTDVLVSMVRDDKLDLTVNNDSLNDPAPGKIKRLKVDYEINGVAGSGTILEGARLRLSARDKSVAAPKSRLVIHKAQYGDLSGGIFNDVTAILAAKLKDDKLDVIANNENFDDPAPERGKQLKVDYEINGLPGSKTIFEGARLRLSASDKPAVAPASISSKLVIRKAQYGDLPYGRANDVTAVLATMVRNDALEVTANNDDFGNPEPAAKKKLRVDFTFAGQKKTKTVEENQTLKISSISD